MKKVNKLFPKSICYNIKICYAANPCTDVLSLSLSLSVTYWPSTEPSIKRCTSVNKRNKCIRSKISKYHLDMWTWLNSMQMRTPTGGRSASNNYITRCHSRLESAGQFEFQLQLESVGEKMPNWEPAADRGLGLPVTHGWAAQPEWERSAAMVRGTLVQCVAVCPNSPLTHNQHQPFRNPFENKVWEVYFL